jgi:hypothetical protein
MQLGRPTQLPPLCYYQLASPFADFASRRRDTFPDWPRWVPVDMPISTTVALPDHAPHCPPDPRPASVSSSSETSLPDESAGLPPLPAHLGRLYLAELRVLCKERGLSLQQRRGRKKRKIHLIEALEEWRAPSRSRRGLPVPRVASPYYTSQASSRNANYEYQWGRRLGRALREMFSEDEMQALFYCSI